MVRAKVNGKPVTQAQLEALIALIPPEQRPAIAGNPDELLRYYGFVSRMAEMAEQSKLAEQSPYKEQLELSRKSVLAQAEMETHERGSQISNAEVEQYYNAHQDRFTTANITVAQVPIKNDSEAAAAKTKAESLWNQLQSGGKFDDIAKQYPVDGDFKSFKKTDASVPAEIKDAVFQLKPGRLTKPISRANGVFIVRLDGLEVKPLREVSGDIMKSMLDARYQEWLAAVRASVVIEK
jgi:parvulin-like peptidyl-prolyl isomerase